MESRPIPTDAVVAELVRALDAGQREAFEERAAIVEYAAGLPRGHAECLAMLEILRRYPMVLTGICALHLERHGGSEWLVTTDLQQARQSLVQIGSREIGVLSLADVLNTQYAGTAVLTTLD